MEANLRLPLGRALLRIAAGPLFGSDVWDLLKRSEQTKPIAGNVCWSGFTLTLSFLCHKNGVSSGTNTWRYSRGNWVCRVFPLDRSVRLAPSSTFGSFVVYRTDEHPSRNQKCRQLLTTRAGESSRPLTKLFGLLSVPIGQFDTKRVLEKRIPISFF